MGSGIEFKSDDHFHSFMSQMMGKIYIDKIAYIIDKNYNLICCTQALKEITDIEYPDKFKPAPDQKINQILAKSFGFSKEEAEQFRLKDLEVMTTGKRTVDRIKTHSNHSEISPYYECVREPWKLKESTDVFVVLSQISE